MKKINITVTGALGRMGKILIKRISKNKNLIKQLRLKKAFGVNKTFSERKIPGSYDCVTLGFNYRMSELNAAIGIEQVKKVPFF